MRQLIYLSRSVRADIGDELATILCQSRGNNALSGITGLLWTNGRRFIQLLEGNDDAVERLFSTIKDDPRHDDVTLLLSRSVDERSFGRWKMALYDDGDKRLSAALREADAETRSMLSELFLTYGRIEP